MNQSKIFINTGAIIYNDSSLKDSFLKILLPAMVIFEEDVKKLSCIFLYDQTEQIIEEWKISDGIATVQHDKYGNVAFCSIGLSIKLLDFSEEYNIMVFLHEIAHIRQGINNRIFTNEHDAEFHKLLNTLIDKYNRDYKANVKNDYYGLKMNT